MRKALEQGAPSNKFINVINVSKPCSKAGIEKTFSQSRSLFALTQGNRINRKLFNQVFQLAPRDHSQCSANAATTGEASSSGGTVPLGRIGGLCEATIR